VTTTATLVQLAAELTLFVVAVAGAGLSVRTGLLGLDRAARLLLVFGFAVLAASAFAVGSLAVDRAEEPAALAALRVAGAVLVALGALRWAGSRRGRPLLLAGLVVLVAAAVVDARGVDLGADRVGAEPLVLAAAALMAAALVVAGRHTIPGRIGTSVAGVLLAVVLLVSLSLSAVISATVEDEALRRYGARASAEADAAQAEAEGALDAANLVAASAGARLGDDLGRLADPDAEPAVADAARARVATAVAALVGPDGLSVDGPVVVVDPGGAPEVAVPEALGTATRLALGGDAVVREALDVDGPRQGVAVVGRDAYALAAVPVRAAAGGTRGTVGVVVVASPLDDAFLQRRAAQGEAVSLALVAGDGVVATAGPQPSPAQLRARARAVVDSAGRGFDGDVAGRFVVTRPVAAGGLPPQMALVLSTPTDRVGRTREDLYRSLFAVALAAGLAGIALSIVVGERIGGAIRRLTAAAARIREGDLEARAAVDREDELGELSETFDAMAASVHDLTDDLRRSAAAEGRLRARLESVFAGVAEAVVAADEDRRVTELNVAALDLLGLDEDDLDGRVLDDLVPLVGPDGDPVALSAPAGGPRLVVGSVRSARDPDAAPTPVVGTIASLHGLDGGRAGTVVVLRDVRREQALEEAKQDFLANIGHELRTPLTPIKGYAGVLRRRTPSPEQAREWAEGIASGVERLEHLVERLVTFTAVTAGPAGAGSGSAGEVDVGAVVEAVVADWRDRLDRPLEVEVEAGLPPVPGEEAHLRLALGELVDNAGRFSPPGSPVRVTAEGRALADGRPGVVLTVLDQGRGAEELGDVVAAFAQGDPSATRRHQGLGLGLALVDRVARAHGGRLVTSSPSQGGTAVSILVPVVTASTGSPVSVDPVPTGPDPHDGSSV